jgi:hypothetical protein
MSGEYNGVLGTDTGLYTDLIIPSDHVIQVVL